MTSTKPAVVRFENFGMLIWSPALDRYFLPKSEAIEDIKIVLDRKRNNKTGVELYSGIDNTLAEDLLKIGFNNTVREINAPLENRLSAPLDVYYDYTWACNLHCKPFCYNRDVDRTNTMTEDEIKIILTQMSKNGIMRTHLAGGEPLINRKRFETYLKTAHEVGMNVSVNSNGTILDNELLNLLFDYDIITLTFSLDGHTSQSHDQYRGKGNFEKTRTNARKVVEKKKQMGRGPRLQYKAVHMFDTPFEQFEGLVKVAIEDGFDVMQFHNPERCINHTKGHYGSREVTEGYYKNIEFIGELQKKYSDKIQIWNIWNPIRSSGNIGLPQMTGCVGGQELIAISADGSLNPCLMNKYSLGNIFGDWNGDFGNFWRNSETLKNFQKTVSYVDERCNDCNVYSNCRGGSKTRIVVNNREEFSEQNISLDDLKGYDPFCTLDYIKKHPDIKLAPWRTYEILNNFKTIIVAHSL